MKAVSNFSLWFLAALLVVCASTANAQVAVYDFYTSDIVLRVFQLTDGGDQVINANSFVTPLSYYQGAPSADYDNGVCFAVPLPQNFTFIYNGIPYNSVNIAVNGWINFGQVPLDTRDPQLLFNANLPNATIAPFFGDHYLRPDATQGFTPSRVSWSVLPDLDPAPGHAGKRIFCVQWENLNINYLTAPDPKQSVATFQVKLYEYSNLQPGRGNIEFEYGNIGHGTVQTSGATVGIEDANGLSFMNGLYTTASDPLDSVRHSFLRTGNWPPSRQPGRAIQFSPFGYILNNWGDGDADLTAFPVAPTGVPIVTPIDALTILRSRVNNFPLDSVFGRSAFHADVNHNGRFTIDLQGKKHNDTSRGTSGLPSDGHPNDVVYFQTTSFDAAYILLYLAGKLPTLPWLVDTIPPFGKQPTDITTILSFGSSATEQNDRFVVLPIMMQGVGAMSAEFNLAFDASAVRLVSVEGAVADMHVVANGAKVAIAGAAEFTTPQIVGYAKFEKLNGASMQTVKATDLSVNDVMSKDVSVTVGAPSTNGVLGAYPEPFSVQDGVTRIFYNTNNDGLVTLKIYDVLGNVIRTLVSNEQAHGSYTVAFDGRDGFNRQLPSGTYFYRLDADGVSTTKQLVIYNGVK